MRKRKYRAWDKTLNCWRYDLQFHVEFDADGEMTLDKDDLVLIEWTGRTDRDGKDIYESDIVKQTYHVERGSVHDGTDISYDGYHIGVVVITASQGICMKKPLCYVEETDETITTNQYKRVAGYRCEVIGNIYENPELLEVS